jgi:NADPH:quinone reductase-like Zn-dependent oxidoreductase
VTGARSWVAAGFGGPEVLRGIATDVPDPGPGEVTIAVRASGMNPADARHIAPGQDRRLLPLRIGYEVAGIVTALGPGTELASSGGAVPMAATFGFDDAPAAFALLTSPHPPGKIALVNGHG